MGGHIRFERGLLLLQLCELALDGGDALAGLAEFLAAELGGVVAVTPESAGSFCEADTPAGAAVFAFSIMSR